MTKSQTSVKVWGSDDVDRSLTRIAHEILERNAETGGVVIIGMQTGGTWLAELISARIGKMGSSGVPHTGVLDVSMYRDDIAIRPAAPVASTDVPVDLTGRTVILVDDVLFTGRTVRAALEALNDHGRPRAVQLAVLVDRGHRELPIRPDFVGKNLPTHVLDEVSCGPEGVFITPGGGS